MKKLFLSCSILFLFAITVSCNKKSDDIAPVTMAACLEEDTLLSEEHNDWFKEHYLYDFNEKSLVKESMTSIAIPSLYYSQGNVIYSDWQKVGKVYDGSDSVDVNLYFEIGSDSKLAYLGIATSLYDAYNEAHPDEMLDVEALLDNYEEIQPSLDSLVNPEGPIKNMNRCRENCARENARCGGSCTPSDISCYIGCGVQYDACNDQCTTHFFVDIWNWLRS